MGNPISKPKKDTSKSPSTLSQIILPTSTKKDPPKKPTSTNTNVCRHLKKIVKCLTFFTQHSNSNDIIDKPRKIIRKRIKKVYKYKYPSQPNIARIHQTGSEITSLSPLPPPPLLPPEFQLHWLRSKNSLLSYALSKLAFFSKSSKEKLPSDPSTSTNPPPPNKHFKFSYKTKTPFRRPRRPTINATSSTTEKEAIIPTTTQGHQTSLYSLKIDEEHQINLSKLKLDQNHQINLSKLKLDQNHQISLSNLNNNSDLRNELLEKILSSPTLGAPHDKHNFLRRKRSMSPEEIFRRNLRRFETLLAITESLSSITSCSSGETIELSEKNVQTEVVDENNNNVQDEEDITVMHVEMEGEFDANGNPINRTSESSLEKKSSGKVTTTTPTHSEIDSKSSSLHQPKIRIITRSKSPVEVDANFMDWVKARMFKSPEEKSVETQSTVVGQVEVETTEGHLSSTSGSSSTDTKKDDTDDKGKDNGDDKGEKKKGPFEYLRKGGGRRASTAGRDWSESRSKSRSPDGTGKRRKGKGKGLKRKTSDTGTATTVSTTATTVKTEETTETWEVTATTERKKKEGMEKKIEGTGRPCEKCGPCAGKYALAGAPPAYLDYGEGEYANHAGEAWKGKRKGDPVMDRLKNVDVVEEMTYLVPNSPDCGGGGDCCREGEEEGEEIEDDCDYYAVCESCGEMEPIPEELKKELQAKRRRKKRKGKSESLPVTYSRRQRFNFKNKGDMCDGDDDGPPYPYEGQQCPGCRCTCCVAGLRRDPDCGCKCCQTMGPLRRCNSFDEIPVGKNPQIRRILNDKEECARRLGICMQQMPDNSGMYSFDKEQKMFERQVPRTPTPIILEVEVPEPMTKEQLLAIGRGIQEKKRLGMPVGTQAHCPPVEQDPLYLPPIYGQCNPPQCPPPQCCVPNCCGTKPGGDQEGGGKKKGGRSESSYGSGSGSGSYPSGSSYTTGYGYDNSTTAGKTSSGIHRKNGRSSTQRNTEINRTSRYPPEQYSFNTSKTKGQESESSGSLPSL